jgi:predicted nucleotidyltransferase
MPVPDVDAARMLTILEKHHVRFVVVGGFAVELWDVAIQPTVDVDITPERSKDNLDRLAAALNELEAELRFGQERVAIPGGFTGQHIEDMLVLNLSTSAGPLDLTIMPAGTEGYPDLIRNASDIDYQGVAVPTAALEDVARSKEAAGRPKDIQTLPAIRAHIERTRRSSSES